MTGVLPIALDKATRIVQILLKTGKEYVGIMHLHKNISEDKIKEAFKEFTGKIKQIPPIRSAVKRQERKREIYYLEILEIKDKDLLFKVGCEAGTYIRKLCHDLGEKLGTGAHMTQLVRTKVGTFNDKNMFTLQELQEAYYLYKNENDEKYLRRIILPYEKAIEFLPKIWVSDLAVDALCHGANLFVKGVSKLNSKIKTNDLVAVLTLKDELIGLGKAKLNSGDILKEEKGIALKSYKVFMSRGIYPKWKK